MTAREVLVHAGQHKTGSTTIQRALSLSTMALQQRGVTVWNIAPNHSVPLMVALDARLGPSSSPEPWRRFRGTAADVWPHLREALLASESTFVISAEGLAKQGSPRLRGLREFVADVVPDAQIRVVLYVRRPDRHLHSYVQQALKGGLTVRQALQDVAVLSYREQVGSMFDAFGRANVDVRLMPELAPFSGCNRLLVDFAEALGKPGIEWPAVAPLNQSMSQAAAELLDEMHAARPPHVAFGQTHRRTTTRVRQQVAGPAFRLLTVDVQATLQRYETDIEWLRQTTGIDLRGPYPEEPPDALEARAAPGGIAES